MELRALRRWLASPRPPAASIVRDHTEAAVRLQTILRALYVFPIFWFATHLHELRPLLSPHGVDLRWPVAWMDVVGVQTAAPWVIGFGFVTAAVGAWLPQYRVVRVLVFLGLLETLGLKFSYGKIHHLMHGWLYTTFIFAAFLPDAAFDARGADRRSRQASLLAFSAAQAMLGLTYTLAGVGKFLGTAYQLARAEVTPLHPEALARHVADRIIQTHADSLLGPFMIEHAVLIWPLMLGTLYLQLFALWAAFRPRLHRPWAFGLIAFHVMTKLSMTIDFTPNILLLGFLYAASPTAPHGLDAGAIARDLPVIGGWLGGVRRVRRPARRTAARPRGAAAPADAGSASLRRSPGWPGS